jgi:hypothetical protein
MAKKKVRKNITKGLWSKNEIQILRKEFPNKPCNEVALKLGRPIYAVKRKAYRLGVYKTKRYLQSLGRA